MQPARVLHVFSSFAAAGPQRRAAQLIEAFGGALQHAILSMDGRTEASTLLPPDARVRLLPPLAKAGSLRSATRLRRLLAAERPDLLLTYNFGAIDALLAARTLGDVRAVHHEDGFLSDEATRLKRRRAWLRRLALPAARRVVVISRNLERIAREVWRQPPERLVLIPNGIEVERFARERAPATLRAELSIPADALVIGSVGHLRPEKNVERLLRAARLALADGLDLHVLVLGEGPERPRLQALADAPPLAGRVHFAGYRDDLRAAYRAMDLLAIPSDTEQMPLALLEAMAASLPVASTDVGDVRAMLPSEQGRFVVPAGAGGDERLARALAELGADPPLRAALGAANRARARAAFGREAMIEAYRGVYAEALGTPLPGRNRPSA